MKYNITDKNAPVMPNLGKGTECIKLLLSQVSEDMREPLVPMLFSVLGAHVCGSEFQYPDNSWKEVCGMMAHLVAVSGMGKGQLTDCIETMMRKFRQHDEAELQKLSAWQKLSKAKKESKKDTPDRPDVALFFPPADVTNPAFIQNAMACELAGNHAQYYNLPEIEMADQMCGSHKKVSKTMIARICTFRVKIAQKGQTLLCKFPSQNI